MLKVFDLRFKEIIKIGLGNKRNIDLANLMSEMESYYRISQIKEIFDRETEESVKELYLKVSDARVF